MLTSATPKPDVPLEGVEMLLPLAAIGLFFLLILGFFAWFFFTANRENLSTDAKETRMHNSSFLKRISKCILSAAADYFFPKSFGNGQNNK